MILYLSGPISSRMDTYKSEFDAAEMYIGTRKGHTVLNPANHPQGLKYEDYIMIDAQMVQAADGIVMLRGWRSSPGAKRELRMALKQGKKVYYGIESVPMAENLHEGK